GTPAFDKPDDLWSILNWLYPRFWNSYWEYYNTHIMFTSYNGFKQIVGVANPEKLHREMAQFYIRRRKEEVLTDLPEKYYTEITVELTPKQRRAYDAMKNDMLSWIGTHESEPVAAPVVIAQLTRLQQFALAHAELTKKKVTRIDETTGQKYDAFEEKMILAEPSSKLDAVMDIIDSLDGKQVVIFSQFAQVIELIASRLAKKGITCGKFIGATPADERGRIISDFQAGKIQVFAGTIAAGGVGITLTAADTVIFTDRAWSNALNLQAEDRLHRIGQKNAVQVIDIIAAKTIDAKRISVIQQKWAWVKRLIGDTDFDPEVGDADDYEL
ncbi:MAG TPA: DEAD/DEAH box helicase, partial [Allocoleopsis sp.]